MGSLVLMAGNDVLQVTVMVGHARWEGGNLALERN